MKITRTKNKRKAESKKEKAKINKTRDFTADQRWAKYKRDKKEKAGINELVKVLEKKDKFVSSKKKKFEKKYGEIGKNPEGKIGKVVRVDW